METLKELSEKVQIKVKKGALKPYDRQDEWQQKANGYRVTLSFQGRRMTIDYWQGIGIKDDPTSYRVLESIMSDAWCQNEDFEDFCSNCGYDTDSRKAYRIFASCQKQTEKLKRMLGGDFDTFLHAEI